MGNNKISMMDAYMIEVLRSNNTSNDDILTLLENKDISSLVNIKPKFDFNELIKLYEQDKSVFKSVLVDGYTVKFLTMNGLKNLLKMKFNKVAEQDYEISDTGIHHLEIDTQHFPTLQKLLSINWIIEEHSATNSDTSKKIVNIQIV
ncbi:hypothetical protein [Psychrobacillus sp. OK032]|uniref:hypothetical protein n=1 Tax=Psychrobacillus sp. OK032 TaxID=1884358 RepID=UPI0008CA6D76|nr:hypothetical protein [Psychrobacillus sp. OK032]SES00160.1 hypothetical protein SAMN05518872_103133 [Psychrobacillus sp. OK032]